MATKAKPKTGAAVLDDSQPDISDGQSTDIGPGSVGFVATPFLPGPSGPAFPSAINFGMGGEVTQPSDFDRELAASTLVASKGGPAVTELAASAQKGPISQGLIRQPLRRPSEAEATATPPETKPEPLAPRAIAKGAGAEPVKRAEPVTTQTPTPAATTPAATTPAATTSTPAAAATPTTSPTPSATTSSSTSSTVKPEPAEGTPESLPAFQDHNDTIQKYAKQYQVGDQDYSRLDAYTTHDPNFAGTIDGTPIFMDNGDHRVYYRDDLGPGKEIRHYFDAPAGTKEATDGVPVENPEKATISRDAQARMLALSQTQDAIENWKTKLKAFQDKNPGGENWAQRLALQALLNGDTSWGSNALRGVADLTQGPLKITKEMKDLDAARAEMAVAYSQAASKNLPTSEAIRTSLNLPLTADDVDTQNSRVSGMEDAIAREARSLQTLYPQANKMVESMLKRIGQGRGSGQQGTQQNASGGSTQRPAATPAPTPSPTPGAPVNLDQDHDHSIWNSLPSGTKVIYNGKHGTKP